MNADTPMTLGMLRDALEEAIRYAEDRGDDAPEVPGLGHLLGSVRIRILSRGEPKADPSETGVVAALPWIERKLREAIGKDELTGTCARCGRDVRLAAAEYASGSPMHWDCGKADPEPAAEPTQKDWAWLADASLGFWPQSHRIGDAARRLAAGDLMLIQASAWVRAAKTRDERDALKAENAKLREEFKRALDWLTFAAERIREAQAMNEKARHVGGPEGANNIDRFVDGVKDLAS